jgi:hypothetical protein
MSALPTHGERRASPWKGLALVLLVAALLRLCVILAPPVDLFDRGQVPHEEVLRGVAAKELIDGPLAPVQDYQVNHFWGGSLFVSFLAVPTFLVLGPTAVALRLVTLVFSLSSVWLAFLILDRFASRRAAWCAAWLLALAPPGYVISSCTLYGTHLESNALALLIAYVYLRWRAAGRSLVLATVFGLVCGFAFWFGYGLILVILAAFLFEVLEDALFWLRRPFLFYAVGFLIGAAPWIRYMRLHPGRALDVYDVSIAKHFELGIEIGKPWAKLYDFLVHDWAESFWFQRTFGFDGMWLGRLMTIVLLVLLGRYVRDRIRALVGAWRARRRIPRATLAPLTVGPGELSAAFVLLFLPAYCLSDFMIGKHTLVQNFRYLMPLWPFVALLTGMAVEDLASHGARLGRIAVASVAAACLVFGAGTLLRCEPSKVRSNWSTPGASDEYLLRFLLLHFGQNAELMDAVVARIRVTRTPEEQDRLLRELAGGLHELVRTNGTASDDGGERRRNFRSMLEHLRDTLPPQYKPLFDPGPALR